MTSALRGRSFGHIFLNAFILFHVACITSWSLPGPPKLVRPFTRLVQPYLVRSGLWQGWDMFAPNPLSINGNVDAQLTFLDGTRKTWVFPRIEEMTLWERYRKERYRKWRERVRLDKYAAIWPDTARYLARLHHDAANPVVHVRLIRHWTPIPPPSGQTLGSRPSKVEMTNHYEFFSYWVKPGDLP